MATGDAAVILEEFAADGGDLALRYHKAGEGAHGVIDFPGPAVLFPRCASRLELRLGDGKRVACVDAYTVVLLAPRLSAAIAGLTAVSEWAAMAPSAALLRKVDGLYGIDVGKVLAAQPACALLPRTNWLNEIMHRYVYERVVARGAGNEATAFLEAEIVKEIHYRCLEAGDKLKSRFDLDDKAMDGRDALVRRAMTFIEANLFGRLEIAAVAKACAASESSLLRAFRAALGKTPSAYVAERRLDEAMILLKSRRYSVAQVSDLIGYEGVSAFGAAFKKRFGVSPGQVLMGEPGA